MTKPKPAESYACFDLAVNKAPHLCKVKYCTRCRAYGRTVCHCHHLAAWRMRNPDKAAFFTLRDHAKRKKIKFTLTFEQFQAVAKEAHYVELKGNTPDALQIDRIDATQGYEWLNVRVLTCSDNATKGATIDKLRKREALSDILYAQEDLSEVADDCPF